MNVILQACSRKTLCVFFAGGILFGMTSLYSNFPLSLFPISSHQLKILPSTGVQDFFSLLNQWSLKIPLLAAHHDQYI